MEIKTRFAPSPTGHLHIGGARTALYSWLFARNQNGKFVLRIEDSDLNRLNLNSIKNIMNSMNWLKLEWDEGPYFQTKRFDRYHAVIDEMLNTGTAYKCYCSKERLDLLRVKQISNGEKPRYDGRCRNNYGLSTFSKSYVVRFANPIDGCVTFIDKVRGLIKFNNKELDDLVICRADKMPTYNFCTVIDDWDMKITHVIRGEDHISNTPRQINIFKALNTSIPIYAHASMINGNDGRKLSKRHGAMSIMQYRYLGYLPEAILNYLLRLGWSKGNQEIFNINEMIKYFSLKHIGKSVSIFNHNKLLWFNSYYMNTLSEEYIASQLDWHFKKEKINTDCGPNLLTFVKLIRNRHKTLREIVTTYSYLYKKIGEIDINILKKYFCVTSILPLKVVRNKISSIKEWTADNIYCAILSSASELSLNKNLITMLLRVVITGTEKSPPIDKIIHLLNRDRVIKSINNILNIIVNNII